MEDVTFERSHSQSPLPEAGNDPGDPLRPEIDEENSTPNPPIAEPHQDMEVTEAIEGMPDQDDLQEAGLSDDESALSEYDDAQFDEFDAEKIAVEERPTQLIDDTNLNLIGVHKRKRTAGEDAAPKKKKKRVEKSRRKKNKDDEAGGDEAGGRKKKSRKEGRVRGASPTEENDENLTPEQRTYLAIMEKCISVY
jgi:transcription factor SPN1